MSTTNPPEIAKPSTEEYIRAISYRRTVYPLSDSVSVSDARIEEIVKSVLAVSPSSYNTQPMRVAILLGEKHKQLWHIIKENALPILLEASEQVHAALSEKFDMYQAAYGSITFWEDQETMKRSQEMHKAAAHVFPQFGEHSNGMLQIQVWTALELEGLGANLQHMHVFDSVTKKVREAFDIPETWEWRAGLNIGAETTPRPSVPDKLPFSETLRVI
ncbi:nitroreductase family protein [Pyrenochaeta sp. DS3sAY3a]|nr:nitroreductase family protein [Pyrenochaeta sp. DS3sAY3a]